MQLGLFSFKIQNTNKNTTQGSANFFLFIMYNGFFICQLYTALYHQQLDTVQVNTAFTICILKVCMYLYIYINTYIYIYMHIYIYIYYMYIFIYTIYTYIYVCMEGIFIYIIYIIDYICYIYYIYYIYHIYDVYKLNIFIYKV